MAVTTDGAVIARIARITDVSDRLSALGTEASTVVPLSIETGATVPPAGAMSGNLFGGQMTLGSVIIGAQRGAQRGGAGVKVTGETGQAAMNHGTATCRLGDMTMRGIAKTRIVIIGGD